MLSLLVVRASLWILVITFIPLSMMRSWAYSDKECISCHRIGSQESELQIDIGLYETSVHSEVIACTDCHQGVTENDHTTRTGFHKVNCQRCHRKKNMHSKNKDISCATCHTEHEIYGSKDSRSSVNFENLSKTCHSCHPLETGNTSWLSFFTSFRIASHPKGNFAKRFDKRMCVGCHQGQAAHGEDGPINNQECYKCHLILADKKAVLGYIHLDSNWQNQPVNVFAGYITLIVLIGSLFFLFIAFKDLFFSSKSGR